MFCGQNLTTAQRTSSRSLAGRSFDIFATDPLSEPLKPDDAELRAAPQVIAKVRHAAIAGRFPSVDGIDHRWSRDQTELQGFLPQSSHRRRLGLLQ